MLAKAIGHVILVVDGSTAHSEHVAAMLRARGIATLLVGLDAHGDIAGRATRLVTVIDGARGDVPLGLFGSGDGASVALLAASLRPALVTAVVSCGGRTDLAPSVLEQIRAATLFIGGSRDHFGLRRDRATATKMIAPHQHIIVSGTDSAFSGPGALDEVGAFAVDWFAENFRRQTPTQRAAAT